MSLSEKLSIIPFFAEALNNPKSIFWDLSGPQTGLKWIFCLQLDTGSVQKGETAIFQWFWAILLPLAQKLIPTLGKVRIGKNLKTGSKEKAAGISAKKLVWENLWDPGYLFRQKHRLIFDSKGTKFDFKKGPQKEIAHPWVWSEFVLLLLLGLLYHSICLPVMYLGTFALRHQITNMKSK